MTTLFPMVFENEEFRLLTAIVLGFAFGFVLERAGFGNSKKLAAQFYFYDMTVFKVMFTAILVAMVGIFGLAELGYLNLSNLWINPTFLPAQAVGGFLLGAGFIVSGFCPGTSVVACASGKIDGLVTLAGVFVGTALFVVLMGTFPSLQAFYYLGSGEVILLSDLIGVAPVVLSLIIVVGALAAFLGAEKVEALLAATKTRLDPTPPVPSNRRIKYAMAGTLAGLALIAANAHLPSAGGPEVQAASIAPLSVAESLIRREPGVMILDLRVDEAPEGRVPTAIPAGDREAVRPLLEGAAPGTRVVLYDAHGALDTVPAGWPASLEYVLLEGGYDGWTAQVLTPLEGPGKNLAERERIARQNQVSGYFSGAAIAAPTSDLMALPAIVPNSGAKKKKAGGC